MKDILRSVFMFFNSFPKKFNKDLQKVLKVIPQKTDRNISIGISEEKVEYRLENDVISIPYRMYFCDVDPAQIKHLTDTQKTILYCIYTRNNNGFIREKYLKELLKLDFDYWVIPFIFKLCDEYVMEILEDVYENLKGRDNSDFKRFCLENIKTVQKSYCRMLSYWNEFYRIRVYKFRTYVGRKLFRECFGYDRTFERLDKQNEEI